jgi:excinuclease ABC subunit C
LGAFTKNLQEEMSLASKNLQFERAQEIKDTLQRLGSLKTRQKMESTTGADEEYFGIMVSEQTAQIMTFKKINGVIRDSNKYSFDLVGDNTFANFLYQYYTTNQIPPYVITNQIPEDHILLEQMFTKLAGFSVKIISPKSGKRREMLDLIIKNITLVQSSGAEPGLVELREKLALPRIPKIIECFDISNHGKSYAVGSMSRFVNGRPDKSGYKKFKIKTVSGQDDFAMINEIVKRRYFRLDNESLQMPDLILVDGGRGQLGAAMSALESMAIRIPCASLAKENEEVYLPSQKEPIIIPRQNQSLKILQHARDEAHRFGVAYNRSLRMPKSKFS